MTYLYELEIQSFHNGTECERYGIGIFRTRQKAEDTAKRYLSEVPGFKDYYCEYSVRKTELIGNGGIDRVYTWYGWNGYEDDILSGLMYEEKAAAQASMEAAKDATPREEWVLNCFEIGKCEWAEGFVREYPDGSPATTLAELRDGLETMAGSRAVCGIEFEYSDHAQYYFPIAVGEALFLSAVDDDFVLNGFTVRRLRDIFDLDKRTGIYQTIAEKEGLTDFNAPDVEINNWQTVFTSLQKLGKHIIVEREYEPEFFRLGIIESVGEDHVLFRYYDADGIWQEPKKIFYREITSVTFDDRYANAYSKYV